MQADVQVFIIRDLSDPAKAIAAFVCFILHPLPKKVKLSMRAKGLLSVSFPKTYPIYHSENTHWTQTPVTLQIMHEMLIHHI